MSGLPAYTVEAQLGSAWTDISGYLELAEGQLSITRGRQDEQSQPQVGQLTCTLNNSDGRFTPGLASSPYYPYIQDGAPVRVSVLMPVGVNLADNPSLENGTGEWVAGGTVPPSIGPSTTHAYPDGGTWSLLVTWGTGGTAPQAYRIIYGLTAGQQYTASAYIYAPTGSPNVQLGIAGGAIGSASTTHDAFVRVSVTFIASATSHSLQVLSATSPTSGQQVWVDALQLETGASATTYSPVGAVRLPRFYGFALEWSFGWQGSQAAYALTNLTAVDLTHRLGSPAGKLRPFDVEEALLDSPLTYLPLDEPEGATQAGNLGSVQGTGALVNPGGGGTLVFAQATGPPRDGTSAPVFTPASSTSGWCIRCPTVLSSSMVTVEAFINSSTATGTILDLSNSPNGSTSAGAGTGMTLSIDAARKLQWKSDNGALTVTSSSIVASGSTTLVTATYVANGTNHIATLYVNGNQVATGNLASASMSLVASYLLVGGGAKLPMYTGTINHLGVYSTTLSVARISSHYHAGWDGFEGERSDARISRLAAYSGLASLTPAIVVNVWVLDDAVNSVLGTTTTLAGSQLELGAGQATCHGQHDGGDDPIAAMQAVAVTEGGLVLADTSGFLQFQTRAYRYDVAASMSVAAENVLPDLAPTYDNQLVINDATVTTADGAAQRFFDAASITQRGTYGTEVSSLTQDVEDAYQAAAWLVHQHSTPMVAYPGVNLDLFTLPADIVRAALNLEVSDRLDIIALPSQAPTSSVSLFVEGYTETVGPDTFVLSLNTSSATSWRVWLLNSSDYLLGIGSVLAWGARPVVAAGFDELPPVPPPSALYPDTTVYPDTTLYPGG
jgi:hypothetical protein